MKTLTLISAILAVGLLAGCESMEKAESKSVTTPEYDECVATANKTKTNKAECNKFLK